MKNGFTGRSMVAAALLASLALVNGCCTKKSSPQAKYYSDAPAGGTGSEYQSSSGRSSSMEGQTNLVVPLYKESLAVGKREVDAGSVRVKKIVKTETVNQPVELRHEEIIIERQPATGQPAQGQMSDKAFEEQEMTIHLTREEPVIEKRTTSASQIVLQKRSSAEQTNIAAQVRSEDVDIVKIGNPQNVMIEGATGGAESTGGQASGASSSGTITDPAMLSAAADSQSLVGRSVQFSNLKVQKVSGDLVVLDSGSSQPLYTHVAQWAGKFQPGDTVNLRGTIKSASSSALSGESAQTLSSQSIYIDAERIETTGR